MAISKQDRSVALTIGLVLIVCIVSLVAIGSILIRLITPGVERIANLLGAGARVSGVVNYNFPIPATTVVVAPVTSSSSTSTTASTQSSSTANNNQNRLDIQLPKERNLTAIQHAAIGKRYGLEKLVTIQNQVASRSNLIQIVGHVYTPKLGLYSPILSTNDGNAALNYGLWLHPNSVGVNQAEWGVLCERSLFQPFSQNSCLFLDELTQQDELWIIIANTVYKYRIVQTLASNSQNSSINNYSLLGNSLRIITNDLERTHVQILVTEPIDTFSVV